MERWRMEKKWIEQRSRNCMRSGGMEMERLEMKRLPSVLQVDELAPIFVAPPPRSCTLV